MKTKSDIELKKIASRNGPKQYLAFDELARRIREDPSIWNPEEPWWWNPLDVTACTQRHRGRVGVPRVFTAMQRRQRPRACAEAGCQTRRARQPTGPGHGFAPHQVPRSGCQGDFFVNFKRGNVFPVHRIRLSVHLAERTHLRCRQAPRRAPRSGRGRVLDAKLRGKLGDQRTAVSRREPPRPFQYLPAEVTVVGWRYHQLQEEGTCPSTTHRKMRADIYVQPSIPASMASGAACTSPAPIG